MIVKLEKLKVHRIHSEIYVANENDLEDLKQSIQESGLLERIVVNIQLIILSGVRRFLALKELGYTETDVIISNTPSCDEALTLISFNKQREKTATEMVNEVENLKLIWSAKRGRKSTNGDRSEKVDTRAKISKATHISTGNISKLEYIKKKKPELLAQIDNGKYTINQAHNFAVKLEENKNVTDIDAHLPEVITNDFYQIINKSSDDLSDIPDESVQMVFTSPPYWKLRNYTNSKNELGNEDTSEEYVQRMADHLHACYRVLKEEGSFFLNLGDTFVDKQLMSIPHRVQIELSKRSWILKQTIVWKKLNPMPSSGTGLTQSFEFIFHFIKSKKYVHNEILIPLKGESKPKLCVISRKGSGERALDYGRVCIAGLKEGKQLENFWSPDIVYTATANQTAVKRYGGKTHPAPFPSAICLLPILQSSDPGDIVLDLFAGSSTTGEISLLLGRRYIGYELNPSYNKLQVARLDDAIEKYNQAELKKAA